MAYVKKCSMCAAHFPTRYSPLNNSVAIYRSVHSKTLSVGTLHREQNAKTPRATRPEGSACQLSGLVLCPLS